MSVLPRATAQFRWREVSARVAGPNPYRPAPGNLRPTIDLPCQEITSIDDVVMWADPDTGIGAVYTVKPVSIVSGVVTYLVCYPSGAKTHADHAHDLAFIKAKGANAANADANALGTAAGVDLTVTGGGADGGVAVAKQADHAASVGSELPNDVVNLANVVVHAEALGRVK